MMPISVTPLIGGLLALAIAIVAWLGDYRRARRKNPDAVGFMPWTTVFFFALFAACLLLGLAGRAWLAG
jgi:hypothetical protein